MKVFALGGAGRVGQATARILAASDVVSEVVIAGRNLDIAERFAAELGDIASAVQIDAADERRFASLAADCDVVVNTAGLDFKVPLPAVRASIRAGTHYCDIGADGPMTEQILELDTDARAAGVTVLPGIGVAPGLTNLMVMQAAARFDEAEEIQFGYLWVSQSLSDPRRAADEMRRSGRVNASWQTVLSFASGTVRIYREGQWMDVNSFQSGVDVTLPHTGPVITAYPIGSPEPITLPRFRPGFKTITSLVALFPPQLNELYREQARRLEVGEVDAPGAVLALLEAAADDPGRWLTRPEGFPSVPLWLTATGRKDGRRAQYACWPTVGWLSTAGVLAAAALRILRGDITERGVLPPEACLEPTPFFAEVALYGREQPPDGKLFGESFELLA